MQDIIIIIIIVGGKIKAAIIYLNDPDLYFYYLFNYSIILEVIGNIRNQALEELKLINCPMKLQSCNTSVPYSVLSLGPELGWSRSGFRELLMPQIRF